MCMHVLCDEIDRAEWSRLVAESATGTWFQTPEAYDFFASQPELFEPFCLGVRSAQGLRGVCVGYVTKEHSAFKQFFTRRAIIIGGPCLADDATNAEVEGLMSAVRTSLQHKAIYVETRNFNDYSRWREAFEQAGFAYQAHLNFHVDCTDEEAMEKRISRGKKRDIQTTLREGVTIVQHPTEAQVKEYYAILDKLYRTKVKTPLFPLSFFLCLNAHRDGRLLLTQYENKIVGGTVCVELNKKCVYEWFVCGEEHVAPHVFPASLATYAAIRYAAEHGCARFDMMGAGTPEEAYGVRDFKARFGGQEVEHGRWLCVNKPLLYEIGKWGVRILKR